MAANAVAKRRLLAMMQRCGGPQRVSAASKIVRSAGVVTEVRPKSREAAKQETRDALLRAGTELYLDATSEPSLDMICAHAGYTRGAFYVHFKDRTEFLLAVIDNLLREFLDAVIADHGAVTSEVRGGQVSETISRFIKAARVERGDSEISGPSALLAS